MPSFFDGLEIGDTTLADGRRIVLFTSRKSLELLSRSDCIAMDGTFKITPSPWKQVGIISAEISTECWIPIAFGLLPDKKRDTYDTFFGLLKTALTSQNLELSARTVMSDFEVSIHYKLYPIPCKISFYKVLDISFKSNIDAKSWWILKAVFLKIFENVVIERMN